MNTALSPEQVAHYREHGFVSQPDFLTPAELARWCDLVDRSVARRGDTVILGLNDADTAQARAGDETINKAFKQRVNLWIDNAEMRSLLINPELGRMMATLAGIDGIRIWHDQALIKEAWGNGTAWHKDDPYWSFYTPNAISIWVALDDATLENGCLYFIPGSHMDGEYRNAGIGANMDGIFAVYPEYKTRQAVPVPLRAGGCTMHNGLTIHGAGANMTPGQRRAMTCAYMPDGATFNGQANILSAAQVAALRVGDPLDDDRLNPLIWSASKPYVTYDDQYRLWREGRPLTIAFSEPAYATPRT